MEAGDQEAGDQMDGGTGVRVWIAALWAAVGLSILVPVSGRADVARENPDPILRLDLPGHTGEVRALAFTADSTRLISGGRDKLAIVWSIDGRAENDADEPAEGERATRDIARRRLKERALRWQVARGTRGAIQAIAVSPDRGRSVVAIAGSGAMGSTGEILLLDAKDGTLVKTLGGGDRPGHRQSIAALDFTADGGWLVSQDLDGQVFGWKRADEWKPVEIAAREETRLGKEAAALLRRLPAVRPLAAIGVDRVAVPTLVSEPAAATPVWRLRLVSLDRPLEQARWQTLSGDHLGVVTAVSATPDGRHLATADFAGRVRVFHAAAAADGQEAKWSVDEFVVKPVAEALALLPDGRRVAVGVAAADDGQPPRMEVWDAAAPRMVRSRPAAAAVRAVRASRDGRWLAWSGGGRHEVFVEAFADDDGPDVKPPEDRPAIRRLGGVGRNVTRVAFSTAAADARAAAEPPPPKAGQRNVMRRQKKADDEAPPTWPRRVAISTALPPRQAGVDREPPAFDSAFDLGLLSREGVGAEADWAAAAGRAGGWAIRPAAAADTPPGMERWQLVRNAAAAGIVDLALDWQGRAGAGGTAIAWLAKPGAQEPWALAIGTDRGIFVYRLEPAAAAACPLVRRFRGHEDRVLSLAVSEDGRWLVSGGGDALVMFWSLSDIDRDQPLTDRWGVGLTVENGRAVVEKVDEAGPLAGKDVRAGDVITKVSWADGAGPQARTEHVDGAAIRAALAGVAWSTQVVFVTEREGQARDPFNRFPAWENLASLHLAANREWAYWTPRGYYAASANGDTFFGWLVNRGLDRLPSFFRANQFRLRLERPDVMARLLELGSLDAALRAAGRDVPKSSAIVLPEQIAQAPDVRILSPRPGDAAAGDTLTVQAEVLLPEGVEIDRMRAYASGAVAAAEPRVVDTQPAAAGRPARTVYEWKVALPAEERHLVQVFAATRQGPTDVHEVPVEGAAVAPPPRREPRLYMLAAGVDRYAHADRYSDLGLSNLEFAVADARSVRDSLSRRSLELYDLAADRIIADEAATRDGCKAAIRNLAESLRDVVEPDDLLVVFLAGHGMVDVEAGRTYAYLCHDAEIGVAADQEPVPAAAGSLRWHDFEELARIPCRKLALVDTCHSGALGPATRSETIRDFQENMVVVLAAAGDGEPSQEAETWGHGAFTKILLEALEGRADVGRSRSRIQSASAVERKPLSRGRPDGVVSLDEIIDYVLRHVPELTRVGNDDDTAQHPTVSPESLVPYVTVPLVSLDTAEKEPATLRPK
jgi:WD40 repeat protein